MSSFMKVQTDIWPIFESVTVKLGEICVTLAIIFWLLTAKFSDTFANCPEKKPNNHNIEEARLKAETIVWKIRLIYSENYC